MPEVRGQLVAGCPPVRGLRLMRVPTTVGESEQVFHPSLKPSPLPRPTGLLCGVSMFNQERRSLASTGNSKLMRG